MKLCRFELTLFANDGVFLDVNQRIQGSLVLGLKKPLKIRYLMVGWSTRCNSEQVFQEKVRIGKQVYVEKVQCLMGEIEKSEVQCLEAKEHAFHFEIECHEITGTEDTASTKLSSHNFKAALVDANGDMHCADIVVCPIPTDDLKSWQLAGETEKNRLFTLDVSPKIATPDIHAVADECKLNGNERTKDSKRDVDLNCLLHKQFFTVQDIVSFTVQCRNNSKKGFRHLTATLIERSTKQAKKLPKARIVASVTGPSVGPKELVSWNGHVAPLLLEKNSESWFSLKIELKGRFSAKLIVQVPVVITEDPLTPT